MTKMKVVTISPEKTSVFIKQGKNQGWFDVRVEVGEIDFDWRKKTYSKYIPKDKELKKWQEKKIIFNEALGLALSTLEKEGIIWQNSDGSWGTVVKY